MSGSWVAIEGGEACGKSTQARRLADRVGALLTREPGGTPLGAQLRALLLDPATGSLDARAEALLMLADRAQHTTEVLRPALVEGRRIVSDRSAGSTLAYQGFGRGLAIEELRRVSGWASGDLWPDLTVLLDLPLEAATARVADAPDRFEREADGFHAAVHEGFRALAAADPVGWAVVDGRGSIEDVGARIDAVVAERLGW